MGNTVTYDSRDDIDPADDDSIGSHNSHRSIGSTYAPSSSGMFSIPNPSAITGMFGTESSNKNLHNGSKSHNVSTTPTGVTKQQALLLQRRGSSFLEEPITTKSTERGEAPMSPLTTVGSIAISRSGAASSLTNTGSGGTSNNSSPNRNKGRNGSRHSSSTKNNVLRFAVSEMQGWRSHMEDRHALCPKLYELCQDSNITTDLAQTSSSMSGTQCTAKKEVLKDHYLFAVFDGHGGNFASEFAGDNLVEILTSRPEWKEYLKMPKADLSATHNMYSSGLSTSSRGSGSTASSGRDGPESSGSTVASHCSANPHYSHLYKDPNTPTRGSIPALTLLKKTLISTFLTIDSQLLEAQRSKRISQLNELETYLASNFGLGVVAEQEVFQDGTADNNMVRSFCKGCPPSLPANVQLERSGSTGVVVLVTPTHVICANAGDSRALLVREGLALPLSFDHKPCNDVEMNRVDRAGGFVKGGRVDGDLAVSRSFGDFAYKNCSSHGDNVGVGTGGGAGSVDNAGVGEGGIGSGHELCGVDGPNAVGCGVGNCGSGYTTRVKEAKSTRVTAYPDLLVHPRDYERDEFIVLACDGVWDRLTNRDCATLVRALVEEEESDPGLICEEIIDTCLELDSRDNMTCAVVVFPGAKMLAQPPSTQTPKGSSSKSTRDNQLVGVMKRRAAREKEWGKDSTPAKRAAKRLEQRRSKNSQQLSKMLGGTGGASGNNATASKPKPQATKNQATPKPQSPPQDPPSTKLQVVTQKAQKTSSKGRRSTKKIQIAKQ